MDGKRDIVCILAVCTSIFLTACTGGGPDDGIRADMDSTVNTTDITEIPKRYTANMNDVEFDMEIEMPEDIKPDALYKSTAVLQTPDKEGAVKALASGKNMKEERKDTGKGENGTVFETWYCSFEDGTALMTDTALVYTTPFFERVHNAFRIEKISGFNAGRYSPNGTFDFMGPEDAFQDILAGINGSGYTLDGYGYDYYALDFETMKQEEEQLGKGESVPEIEGKDWTGDDDSYFFFAEQTYEGISVYYGDQDCPGDDVENRPVQAVYSSRGIERLDIAGIYSFEPSGEKVRLVDFGTVAEKVADKYGSILTGADYKVTRAKLYQMPVKDISGSYEVKLVWLFEVHETGVDSATGGEFDYTIYTFVDAVSGEEVSV